MTAEEALIHIAFLADTAAWCVEQLWEKQDAQTDRQTTTAVEADISLSAIQNIQHVASAWQTMPAPTTTEEETQI